MHYTLYIINLYKIYFRKELYYNMLNNRNYNQIERNALDKKMNSPEKIVICPRCGKKLIYKTFGNSSEVECETENCLYTAIRGI